MVRHAVRFASARQRLHELQPHREVPRRRRQRLAQPRLMARECGAVVRPRFELGERVRHVGIARGLPAEPFEEIARLAGAAGERVELREHQADLGARRVQLTCPEQLVLRLVEAAGPEEGEPEVRVPQRLVRREIDQLPELRLRRRKVVLVEEGEPLAAQGEELLHPRLPLRAAAVRDEGEHDAEEQTSPAPVGPDHSRTGGWVGSMKGVPRSRPGCSRRPADRPIGDGGGTARGGRLHGTGRGKRDRPSARS